MGLLKQFASEPELVVVDEAAPVAPEVFEQPVPPPLVPVKKELDIKRDAHGTIESVTGVDREGRRVKFEFERNGRRQLERIKVR